MEDSLLDSVSLPGLGGALASPGVEQPRRRLGRLRKAGAAQPATGEQGENSAPNAAAQAAGDSLSKEQPLREEEQPRSPADDQEQQDEELELEEEDAAEGGSEAAGGEVRPPPCSHNPVCRLCVGCPGLVRHIHTLCMLLQEYFDEEDELEEAYARRATQKAARRAAPAAAEASEGGWLASMLGVLCWVQAGCSWAVQQKESIRNAWFPAAHLPPADEEEAEGGGREPELSAASGSGGSPGGSPGTLELLACDTQRILRGEPAS